jgi:hypothetical protein
MSFFLDIIKDCPTGRLLRGLLFRELYIHSKSPCWAHKTKQAHVEAATLAATRQRCCLPHAVAARNPPRCRGTGQSCPATSCPPSSSSWGPAVRSCGARSSCARRGGARSSCARREEPGLWRRVGIDVEALVSAGLRKGWGAMVRAAVDRGAGRCESFSGPCDEG